MCFRLVFRVGIYFSLLCACNAVAMPRSHIRNNLLSGAFTDVPVEKNAEYVNLAQDCPRCPDSVTNHEEAMEQYCYLCPELFDNPNDEERKEIVQQCIEERINSCHTPLHVMSAITGVEFHVPGKISNEVGGLSAQPHPILKIANGVKYWFISGELSGYFTDEFGQHIVIGPIDPKGVNHREEPYCALCPAGSEEDSLCCEPNQAVASPRAGLPGAFFGFSIPVQGFKGGLVQIEAAGDGGFLWPAAPMLFNPIDPATLLERGYAVFTFGQGGTVPERVPPGGTAPVIDTNPNSGSGIFWTAPVDANYDDPGGSQELVSYDRPANFNEVTGEETAISSDFRLPIVDPCCDDQIFNVPFGDTKFFFGSVHTYPEIISDSVIFAKNLFKTQFPHAQIKWASYVGWSGSGRAAVLINSNTRAGAFQIFSGNPQAGGGDYNNWGDPSSGLRFNAFLSYAGANDSQGFMEQDFHQSDVNPDLPASAPFVWFIPENDVTLPQTAAYIYANKVWRALAALGHGEQINNLLRIYAIPRASHQARDQLFSPTDSHDTRGGLWYDYADILPNPGAFNQAGRGLRVSDPYVQALPFNGPIESWDFFFHGKAGVPQDTPLWLQVMADLREYSERKVPLPVSRVHASLFDHLDELSTETVLPSYPTVDFSFPETDEELDAQIFEIEHSITEDTGINSTDGDGNTIPRPLSSEEVQELLAFAQDNPLNRTTRPLLLPDAAAPIGTNFYFFDLAFQAPFTRDQLVARYRNHGGYVVAVARTVTSLVRERLWDARLGALDIVRAATSNLFSPSHPSKNEGLKHLSLLRSENPQTHLWQLQEEPRWRGHTKHK